MFANVTRTPADSTNGILFLERIVTTLQACFHFMNNHICCLFQESNKMSGQQYYPYKVSFYTYDNGAGLSIDYQEMMSSFRGKVGRITG